MKRKILVFLCEEISHTKFFFNMEEAFNELNYSCIYLVLDVAVYLQLKNWTSSKVILLKKKTYDCNSNSVFLSK